MDYPAFNNEVEPEDNVKASLNITANSDQPLIGE